MEMNATNTTSKWLIYGICVLAQIHIIMSLPIGLNQQQLKSQVRYRLSKSGIYNPITIPKNMFLDVLEPRPTAAVLSFGRPPNSQSKTEKQSHAIFHSAVGPARSFVSYRNHFSENSNSYSGFDITNSHVPSQQEYLDPPYQQQDKNNRVISTSEYIQPPTQNKKQKVSHSDTNRYQIKSMEWYGPKSNVDKTVQEENPNHISSQNVQNGQYYDQHQHAPADSLPGSQSPQLYKDNFDLQQQTETDPYYDFPQQPTETGQNYDFPQQLTETGQNYNFPQQPTETGPNYDFPQQPTETGQNYDFPQQPTETGPNYDFSQQPSVSDLFPNQQPNENFQALGIESAANTLSEQLAKSHPKANHHQENTQRLSKNNSNNEVKPAIDNGAVIYSHREALKQLKNRNVNDFIKSARNAAKDGILNRNLKSEQNATNLEKGIPNSVLHLAKILSWSPYI